MTLADVQIAPSLSNDRHAALIGLALACMLILVCLASLTFGLEAVAPSELWRVLTSQTHGDTAQIVELRWHRFAVAAAVGAALALSGVILQAVLRNPLAEPGVIGLNSGAALAAAFMLALTTGVASNFALAASAILGATCAVFLVTLLATSAGGIQPLRIILAGIAISALAGAALNAATLVGAPRRLPRLLTWLSGDMNGASAADGLLIWSVLFVSIPLLVFVACRLDIAMLDPVSAAGLGQRGNVSTYGFLALAAGLAGAATAVAGIIVFVGLIAPHIGRRLVGPLSRHLMPVAALLGALTVSVADLLGRTVSPPAQLPAGLICGLIGAPLFFVLMRRFHG